MKTNLSKAKRLFEYLFKGRPFSCLWVLLEIVLLFKDPKAAGLLCICTGLILLIMRVLRPILNKRNIHFTITKK